MEDGVDPEHHPGLAKAADPTRHGKLTVAARKIAFFDVCGREEVNPMGKNPRIQLRLSDVVTAVAVCMVLGANARAAMIAPYTALTIDFSTLAPSSFGALVEVNKAFLMHYDLSGVSGQQVAQASLRVVYVVYGGPTSVHHVDASVSLDPDDPAESLLSSTFVGALTPLRDPQKHGELFFDVTALVNADLTAGRQTSAFFVRPDPWPLPRHDYGSAVMSTGKPPFEADTPYLTLTLVPEPASTLLIAGLLVSSLPILRCRRCFG